MTGRGFIKHNESGDELSHPGTPFQRKPGDSRLPRLAETNTPFAGGIPWDTMGEWVTMGKIGPDGL
jgi:hypothetical protein